MTSPSYDTPGMSFFETINLLWRVPAFDEVRAACLAALLKDRFQSDDYRCIQSNSREVQDWHKHTQKTILAMMWLDFDVAVTITKRYLSLSLLAYKVDYQHRPVDDDKLLSKELLTESLRFALRLLVVREPEFFGERWTHWGSNRLYLNPELLRFIIQLTSQTAWLERQKRFIGKAVSLILYRHTCENNTLDEDTWTLFEYLFRGVLKKDNNEYPHGIISHSFFLSVAGRVHRGAVMFKEDIDFGRVLEIRAKRVCQRYLRVFYSNRSK